MTIADPGAAGPHRLSRAVVASSVAVGIAITVLLLVEARWLAAGLMAIAALAAALAPLLRLPGAFVALVAVASIVNASSIVWDWYLAWPPFDEWAHLLNLVVLVAPSMVWLHRAEIVRARPESLAFVAAGGAYGFGLAIGWEVIEAFIWVFPLWDTVSDIALGVVGSVFGTWWAGRIIRAAGDAPLT